MSNNVHILNLAAYNTPVITESKKDNWVEYGADNNYFQFLIDRYTNSTTNNAIINNVCRLLYGKGLSALDANRKPNEYAQMKALLSDECLRKLFIDRKMLGQSAIQVHYNEKHDKILKAFHIPVNLIRAEKCNENGEIEGYYYSDNWLDTKKYEPKRFSAFGSSKDKIEILFIQPYSVGMKYYSHVDYHGALPYAMLEEEISNYLINEVQNGFSGTKVVNFNNGIPTEEQQDQISSRVLGKLTGSRGQKVIVAFNENAESKTTVDDIPLNDAADQYQFLSEECMRKIMLGHTVTSPLIFGIATSTGFSSNADELKNSVVLFDNMVIRPMQDEMLSAIEKILAFNGISLKLYFKTLQPLEFTDLENTMNKEQVAEETGTELSAEVELDTDGLISLGEDLDLEGWVLVDERDVDYDLEDELDEQLKNYKPKQNLFQKLASAVKAIPNARSSQDKVVKDIQWKVRYQYAGNPNPERAFCKTMMNAKKIYRKEDLENVNSNSVNAGFGHNNEPYNVFLFKGGARCKHSFKRLTFASIEGAGIDVTNPNARKIGTDIASKRGFKVTNPYQVSIQPNNLPNKGFHPANKNLPQDAR
jgi:hypothetical protein